MSSIVNIRIAYLVETLSHSPDDFAYRISVSANTVKSWISGDTIPSLVNICEICNTFSISADFILGFTDYPFRKGSIDEHYLVPNLVSINDLTDSQRNCIHTTLSEFRAENNRNPRSPFAEYYLLDPDLRSKAEGYVDSLIQTQKERDTATKSQEA